MIVRGGVGQAGPGDSDRVIICISGFEQGDREEGWERRSLRWYWRKSGSHEKELTLQQHLVRLKGVTTSRGSRAEKGTVEAEWNEETHLMESRRCR